MRRLGRMWSCCENPFLVFPRLQPRKTAKRTRLWSLSRAALPDNHQHLVRQVCLLEFIFRTEKKPCVFTTSPLTILLRFFFLIIQWEPHVNDSVKPVSSRRFRRGRRRRREQFKRWSHYWCFFFFFFLKTSNNFRAGTICRRFKIFSSARKQSGPLPGLLCAEICSRYGQSSDSTAVIPRALMQTPLHANTLQQQHLFCATLRCRERGWVGRGWVDKKRHI